jgi:methyltransferase-like protein
MATERLERPSPYDRVLYPSRPLPQTHPDRLATQATLFGMRPAGVERCRVLELGCGDGGNLIPMAFGLPKSSFLGIDAAGTPVAEGQATVARLGLANVSLQHRDLMDLPPDVGVFDFIVAHGLYSWVPPAVRARILAVCRECLAPQGVAYVSYSVHPGGHLRSMVREMMRFHVQRQRPPQEGVPQQHLEDATGGEAPAQQARRATAVLAVVAAAQPASDPYGALLAAELERVAAQDPAHLFHDDLADVNEPCSFTQFAAHAAEHGLQYLAEADFFEMQDQLYPERVVTALREWCGDDLLAKEQYLDFLKGRRFRQTLLCHADVPLQRDPAPSRLRSFGVASPARPVSPNPVAAATSVEQFRGPRGASMQTDNALAKAAMLELAEVWPQSLPFDGLLARARARVADGSSPDAPAADDARVLGEILLATYAAGLVELHSHAPCFALEAGARPVASLLARLQAREGTVVTNLRHTSVQVEDALGRHLLGLLDGTRDRPALCEQLAAYVRAAAAAPGRATGAPPLGGPAETERLLRELPAQLDRNLAKLARLALLTG